MPLFTFLLYNENMPPNSLKTWINISRKAAEYNFGVFRTLLQPKTKLFAVVKSNAYGHGLWDFAGLANEFGADGFCADSVMEGVTLRRHGIKKPILVLGPTLPALFKDAAMNKITITLSNFENLAAYLKLKLKPEFHLKIDTGMRRQGLYFGEIRKFIQQFRTSNFELLTRLKGVYTHFASAKDINYPTFTEKQFTEFQKALKIINSAGCENISRHCAATGGAMINPKYHLDAVRLGIGLYGLWPSKELQLQLPKIKLKPVLSWQALISEIKEAKKGDFVSYDLTERLTRTTKIAIIPIGYWHGFDRGLSGVGEVLIGGRRARVLGRVTMDLIMVDITGIKCAVGDRAMIIGRQGSEEITAEDVARKINTSPYEVITRINPLIERLIT